jgi:hypothetical protein
MTKMQLEMWAIKHIDQAIDNQHVEDSHVELKSQWPVVSSIREARETARRIAGHANAARGEPVLWLIGVDERGGKVTGADPVEVSNWWAPSKPNSTELPLASSTSTFSTVEIPDSEFPDRNGCSNPRRFVGGDAELALRPVNSERPLVKEFQFRPNLMQTTAFKSAYWTLERDGQM